MEIRQNDNSINVTFESVPPLSLLEPSIEIQPLLPEWSCRDCNLSFTSRAKYGNHMKKMHSTTKYQCDICHTFFGRVDHLRRHTQTVHSVDKPFVCPFCRLDYLNQGTLREHIQEDHPDETQYNCSKCEYSTGNIETLVSHKKIHVVINKFVCSICNSCFKRQDHLKRHVKTLHLNQIVTCGLCQKSFKRKDHLARHTREKHTVVCIDS